MLFIFECAAQIIRFKRWVINESMLYEMRIRFID